MTEPRQIDVRDQATLSYGKIFELVRSGITHRLLRSTLTMSVILLAVAFFMFSLAESSIVNAVDQGVQAEIAVQRRTPHLLSHIGNKLNSLQMSARLATIVDDPQAIGELQAVSGLELAQIQALVARAHEEQRYLRFFRRLSPGKRIALVDKDKDRDIFRRLADPAAWQRFSELFAGMPELRLPTNLTTFKAFVDGFPVYLTDLAALVTAWNDQIGAFAAVGDGLRAAQPIERWLVEADEADFQRWLTALQEHGFRPEAETIEALRPELALRLRVDDIGAMLKDQEKQRAWLKHFRSRATVDEMLDHLGDPVVREELLEKRWSQAELDEVGAHRSYERQLAGLETDLGAVVGDREEQGLLSNRQIFLLAISFVVCMVGIANAMLMAITERFREIATMKCLGATDRFILVQFMMEAGIQGVAGGVLGMLIGFALTLFKTVLFYGSYPFAYFPFAPVLICALVSLLTGILLAIVASIYPSFSASRMAPMEAMRIE
jgi:cell division protein FtsX